MALLIIAPNRDLEPWLAAFQNLEPDLDLRIWPETGPKETVTCALVWKHPKGTLKQFPNLKLITSMGAGVDHILEDDLPPGVPITKINPQSLAQQMSRYCLEAILSFDGRIDNYRTDQSLREWHPKAARNSVVGLLGVGNLGKDLAGHLVHLGYGVHGFSTAPKAQPGLISWHGSEGLANMLKQINILVCLLPLTPDTRGILNRSLFQQMSPGTYLINVARGQHLVEEDLLEALGNDWLSGACLDVFNIEPLPQDHPFWKHPSIKVTPHVASITDPVQVVPDILENYRRIRHNGPYLHEINQTKGY